MSSIETRIITNDNEWERVISNFNSATVYHTVEWKKLLERHGCKGFLIVAEENGSLEGILPIYFTRNRFNERQFVTIPFAGSEHILINKNSEYVLKALLKEWENLVEKYKPLRSFFRTNLILHEKGEAIPLIDYSFKNNDYKVKEVLYKIFSTSTRQNISNSINRGNVIVEKRRDEILDIYYDMFLDRIIKRYVTFPRYSKDFFKDVLSILEKYIKIFTVENKGKVIAATICLCYNNKLFCWGAVSYNETLKLRPNELLYFELIKTAIENGFNIVHFGSHPIGNDLGLHNIKNRFFNYKTISYLWKINHSLRADLEEFIYSTTVSFKNLIFFNSQQVKR